LSSVDTQSRRKARALESATRTAMEVHAKAIGHGVGVLPARVTPPKQVAALGRELFNTTAQGLLAHACNIHRRGPHRASALSADSLSAWVRFS